MRENQNNKGFSLTEVMMAVGILGIGMVLVAGVFPGAIHFATIATERTTAAIVADEAFAKIRIYNVDFASPQWPPLAGCVDFNDVSKKPVDPNEFAYPSTDSPLWQKKYFWSAVCRRVGDPSSRLVQVTVFVSRKIGTATMYWNPAGFPLSYPVPVKVQVFGIGIPGNLYELRIEDSAQGIDPREETFINDGYTIVDNATGVLHRVRQRDPLRPEIIILSQPWQGADLIAAGGSVWVIPPPIGGGRGPCVEVYQRLIRF